GDVPQAIKHADDGLEAMPENETRGRCGLLCVKEFALWKNGELMAAYRCSEEAAHLSKVVGWTYAVVLSLSSIAHIRFALGHLNSAAETCRQIQSGSLLEGKEISSCCYACLLLAQIHYQWNSLDEAEKQVLRAISQSENGQEPVLCLSSQMALARIYIVRGKADAAIEIAQHAKLIYEAEFPDSVLADIFMTRLWIMRGDYSAAADCSQSWAGSLFSQDVSQTWEKFIFSLLYKGIYDNDIRNIWTEIPWFTYVRVRLAQGKVEGLDQLLAGVRRDVESKQWKSLAIETMILEALVFDAGGNSEAALGALKDALVLAENENYLRLFADEGQPMLQLLKQAKRKGICVGYVTKILSLFSQSAEKKNHNSPDCLTKREMEILELICDGAANKEIAERLYISLPTVKNHIYNIYGKLDIDNRAQAVVRAQELGLLKFD
ncbi:MAG TPA: LuxR C-terminal-related transcriptional regulator, partial [Syntrophomonas sp.]|nr:LuxR C-terminal-related transcriptional regulator [Syntrophomonas sp.]